MNTNDSISNVLRSISRRNPALTSLANDALESLASDDYSMSDQLELAKKIAISNGIDLEMQETDPDMLLTALSEAIIRMAEKIAISETATYIDFDEATDEEIDAAYVKARDLRKKLTTFAIAETNCSVASGFWDRIPSSLHYVYANTLVDLCQGWQVDPLPVWDEKARG